MDAACPADLHESAPGFFFFSGVDSSAFEAIQQLPSIPAVELSDACVKNPLCGAFTLGGTLIGRVPALNSLSSNGTYQSSCGSSGLYIRKPFSGI